MGLKGGEIIATTCLAILTQNPSVTDEETDRYTLHVTLRGDMRYKPEENVHVVT